MQHRVQTLAVREHPKLDPAQIETLKQQLGGPAAEDLVCRAAEELALRIATMERLHNAGDIIGLRKTARGLAGIAGQIGLDSVCLIADDLVRVAGDDSLQRRVATAATMARLVRTAEISLMAIWDLGEKAP